MSPKCVKRERDEGTKVKKAVAIGENIITGWKKGVISKKNTLKESNWWVGSQRCSTSFKIVTLDF